MPPKPTKSKAQPPTHPTTVNTRSRTKEAASQHVSEGQAPRIDLRTVKPTRSSSHHLKHPASPVTYLKSKKVKPTNTQSVRPPKLPVIHSDSDTSDHEMTHTHSDALTNGNESDDLEGMDAVGLKQKLLAERALWGTCKPKNAVNVANSLDDSHEDKTTNQPTTVDINAYDTADNAIDNAHMDIDEDEDAGWYMGEDFDASNGDNADAEPVSRANARRAEVPTWDSTPRNPVVRRIHYQLNTLRLVGGTVTLWLEMMLYFMRHTPANTTIRSLIQEVVSDTLFKNAFPSLNDSYKPFRKVLCATALQLKYSHLAHHFTKDPDFGKQSACLIAQCLADIRGKLKNMADDKVPAIYGLEKLDYDQCRKCVHDLMEQTSYIYARKSTSEIDGGKPFQHPAIISLLRDGVFQAKRKPLIADHTHQFKSTVTDSIGKNELEIPAAMLALIATMVYACLRDWKSGELNSHSDFSVDFLTDMYRDHIEFLGNILDGSKAKYHRMMHNLYIISVTRSKGSLPTSNNAIGLLNFDEMEE
ncbi:hypothetical protein BDQ17DRAFT_1331727 [Cyathus striatus]|nr:hypothetical protein BDQ17DRAFT_1331727 [Cyathus striatus]